MHASRSLTLTPKDRAFLERARSLSQRGWGRVHPNPMVGCVLTKHGVVVGEGWHREFGGPHAEVEALRAAGPSARGSTAYLSLEPCNHQGQTPPCTRALLEAGVARVVFGASDPGPESGGGGPALARAGVEVLGPAYSAREARRQNPAFFHDDPLRPWTVLKLALSSDGRIAARRGVRTPISGPESAEAVHRLRAGFDAILVGTGTARVDDPRLTVRGPVVPRRPPVRVFLDARGTLERDLRALREGDAPVWVVTAPGTPPRWRTGMEAAGARLIDVPSNDEGRLELSALLHRLREEGIGTLLSEGGGRLGSALLRAGHVDRLILITAPSALGGDGVPAFPELPERPGAPGHAPPGGIPGRWTPAGPSRRVGPDVWRTWDRES